MTWHAQIGEIVLEGSERDLFRNAFLLMSDLIVGAISDDESTFGAASVFDAMSRSQQLASLEKVASYLFHPTEQCLDLTAWSEATLASILNEIHSFVLTEIDEGHTTECRDAVAAALGDDAQVVDYDSTDAWEMVLEAYDDRFLWDRDYEDGVVSDLSPEHASHVRHMLTISDDYYSAIPPDLELEEDVTHGSKRLMMVIDGRKTIRLTATATCEVPASFRIMHTAECGPTLEDFFPALVLMRHKRDGDVIQATGQQEAFFLGGGEVSHKIEEL